MRFETSPITLATEAATAAFAAGIGARLTAGDCLLLEGHIGAGKTAFARALIQFRLGHAEDVPSPTYTLVQTYSDGETEIWHCDLYRLTHPDEVMELGLDDAFDSAITLIEWPDRLGDLAPDNALRLRFAAGPDAHSVRISGSDWWRDRLEGLDV